jgi:hypothetical protein
MAKLSARQKSEEIQKHPLLAFKVGENVRLKKEHERTNGGRPMRGYVTHIRIDENGIWYEMMYSASDNGMAYKSTSMLETFIERDN